MRTRGGWGRPARAGGVLRGPVPCPCGAVAKQKGRVGIAAAEPAPTLCCGDAAARRGIRRAGMSDRTSPCAPAPAFMHSGCYAGDARSACGIARGPHMLPALRLNKAARMWFFRGMYCAGMPDVVFCIVKNGDRIPFNMTEDGIYNGRSDKEGIPARA